MIISPKKESVLLIGCGDIAQRLAMVLDANTYQLTGLRRRKTEQQRIAMVQGDCSNALTMQTLLANDYDVIVVSLTPSVKGDRGYKQAYVDTTKVLLNTLGAVAYKPRLMIFVSSTSVYAQQQGQWVDESSQTLPAGFNGQRILEAENLFAQSDFNTCCVRFSGIYGPGRYRLIEQVVAGKGAAATPVSYSNRIHVDDCAGVLAHLINLNKTQALAPLYLASDCLPSTLYEVKHWLAEQLQLPADHLQQTAQVSKRSVGSSKRCRNQRLLDSGYQFLYPDYRAGYRQLLLSWPSSGSC
ncbi:MAG: NAD-dependent epimerase/dehydratase family protein [Cellvibrionaceae bacterium]|nr:NAD-dependent epimerase/dehydratase family protein [Cellvibrionaceae bacterium]